MDYNGITLEDFTKNIMIKNELTRDIVDILFQLSIIAAVLSIKKNLKNTDLHPRNVLVRRLTVPSLRTVVIWNADGTTRFAFSYESALLVTIVDWILSSNDIPYSRPRSSSSRNLSSQSKQSEGSGTGNRSGIWQPPSIPTLLLDALHHLKKFDSSVRFFEELGPGVFSLLTSTRITEILRLKQLNGPAEVPDLFVDLVPWNFRIYHKFSRPRELTPLMAPPDSPKRRGPKRKWKGPRANAEKCRHMRAVKRRRLLSESSPLLLLAEAASERTEDLPMPHAPVPNDQLEISCIDLFGYNHYGGFGFEVYIDWSEVCDGLGVFARDAIPKGTLISDYPGLIITKAIRDTMEDWQLSHLRRDSLLKTYIDGSRVPSPSQGIGPFINSSAGTGITPNAQFRVVESENGSVVIAIDDIRRGQEILIDYQIGWTEPS